MEKKRSTQTLFLRARTKEIFLDSKNYTTRRDDASRFHELHYSERRRLSFSCFCFSIRRKTRRLCFPAQSDYVPSVSTRTFLRTEILKENSHVIVTDLSRHLSCLFSMPSPPPVQRPRDTREALERGREIVQQCRLRLSVCRFDYDSAKKKSLSYSLVASTS